jgi:hypothetical protein
MTNRLEEMMKHVVLTTSLLLVPAAVPAHGQDLSSLSEQARANVAAPADVIALADAADAQATPRVSPPPSQVPPAAAPRRRGSMVGYIDDATIASRVRIRFEAGFHDHVPDRAEFFYAKCGCYRDLPGSLSLDPAAPGPRPGSANDVNFQQAYVQGEYAVGSRFSVFGELPVRWLQPQSFSTPGPGFANQAGISDLRAGAKFALIADARRTLTAQARVYAPTGKAENGLGTNHATIEPTLLYYEAFTPRFALEAQASDWQPLDGSAGVPITSPNKFSGNVFFWGVGPSFEVYRKGAVSFTPIVELIHWHVNGGFQTATPADATGTNIANLKVGARTYWNATNSLYVGYGHALTKASWYDDIVRVEYRFAF